MLGEINDINGQKEFLTALKSFLCSEVGQERSMKKGPRDQLACFTRILGHLMDSPFSGECDKSACIVIARSGRSFGRDDGMSDSGPNGI